MRKMTATIADGVRENADGGGDVVTTLPVSNGTLSCQTKVDMTGSGTAAEVRDRGNRVPRPTSNEKGMANFTDAENHRAYRTRAWKLRKASANNPIAMVNAVDCHR